jgi:hypothetical protein
MWSDGSGLCSDVSDRTLNEFDVDSISSKHTELHTTCQSVNSQPYNMLAENNAIAWDCLICDCPNYSSVCFELILSTSNSFSVLSVISSMDKYIRRFVGIACASWCILMLFMRCINILKFAKVISSSDTLVLSTIVNSCSTL